MPTNAIQQDTSREESEVKKAPAVINIEDLEIREVMELNKETEEEVMKKYIVHKVDASTDSLFKLSYRYKVSKREIQNTNGFSGEDIFFMKEILIPFKSQEVLANVETPDKKEQEEKERRTACLSMLNNAILDHETKNTRTGQIAKTKKL
jgi:hypothetical protein